MLVGEKSSTFTFDESPFLFGQLSPPTAPTTLPDTVNLQIQDKESLQREKINEEVSKKKRREMMRVSQPPRFQLSLRI